MDDIPPTKGELYAGLVLSTHAHANITVDWSKAVQLSGVKGYIGVDDVPGSNTTGNNCLASIPGRLKDGLVYTVCACV